MDSNELSPYRYISRTLDLWWLVFLNMMLGGAFGFTFFYFHPPIYEATSTYYVRIDLAKFPMQGVRDDLLQYNEDLAVNITSEILLSDAVLQDVVSQVAADGLSVTSTDLFRNSTIERKHDLWELRYRNQNPTDAQAIVNAWAKIGYQAMVAWQASGKAESYVIFDPPSSAFLPTHPVLYGRNNLILAGALIGLIVGVVLSNRLSHAPLKASDS